LPPRRDAGAARHPPATRRRSGWLMTTAYAPT
jgi:hypothetical protein